MGNGASACEWWISVIKLGDRADAAVAHFVFKSDKHAVDVADTAHAEYLYICVGIHSDEPRTCGSVVICFDAVLGTSHIEWMIAIALR